MVSTNATGLPMDMALRLQQLQNRRVLKGTESQQAQKAAFTSLSSEPLAADSLGSSSEKDFQPSVEPSAPAATYTSRPLPAGPSNRSAATHSYGLPIAEIQQIAQQAGFIDVSAQDIQRAYHRGESLLVNYSV